MVCISLFFSSIYLIARQLVSFPFFLNLGVFFLSCFFFFFRRPSFPSFSRYVCMSEYSDVLRRPKLEVEYTMCDCMISVSVPVALDGTIGFLDGVEGGPVNELGIGWRIAHGLLDTTGTTIDCKNGIFRFDLAAAALPPPARIVAAKFSLTTGSESESVLYDSDDDFYVHEIVVDYDDTARCLGSPFDGIKMGGTGVCLQEGVNIAAAMALFGSRDALFLDYDETHFVYITATAAKWHTGSLINYGVGVVAKSTNRWGILPFLPFLLSFSSFCFFHPNALFLFFNEFLLPQVFTFRSTQLQLRILD